MLAASVAWMAGRTSSVRSTRLSASPRAAPAVRSRREREREHPDEHRGEEHERRADAESLGDDRGDQRSEHEAGDVERSEAPEVGADRVGIAGDDDAPDRGPDRTAAQPEQQAGEQEGPELGGGRAADHRGHGQEDAAPHQQRCVPAVGEPGEGELRDESGEEPGGDDQPELGLGEAVPVAQIGEQRVDRAVPERHAPRDDAVGEQPRRPLRHGNAQPDRRARSTSRSATRSGRFANGECPTGHSTDSVQRRAMIRCRSGWTPWSSVHTT